MTVEDPVCRTSLSLEDVAATEEHGGWAYFFCSSACRQTFQTSPADYAEAHPSSRDNSARGA